MAISRDMEAKDMYRRAIWVCRCDCGNIVRVPYPMLRDGHTKSCGCLAHDKRRTINDNLTGRRFGNLLVIRPLCKRVETRNKYVIYWHCRCDCGKEVVVTNYALRNGIKTSCGCVRGGCSKDYVLGNPSDSIWMPFPQDFIVGPVYGRKMSSWNASEIVGVEEYHRAYIASLKFDGRYIELGTFPTVDDAMEARLRMQEECVSQILADWKSFQGSGVDIHTVINSIKGRVRARLDAAVAEGLA